MKKENFVTLILGTMGVLLFALGMCMCMIEEWAAFNKGIGVGVIGIAVLIAMWLTRRVMQGKPIINFDLKIFGIAVVFIVGLTIFGLGMCMSLVYEHMMIQGIIVGIVGIVILISVIPLARGLK